MKKTILITGATSGIGYQFILRIINQRHKIIILCRNKSRQKEILLNLKSNLTNSKTLESQIELPIVDLSDLKSIEKFTSKLIKDKTIIDSLILNAGLQYTGSELIRYSCQNIELTFAVNHLSHHYLTNRLIKLLFLSKSPKIIITTSEVHNPLLPGGKVGLPATLGELKGLKSGPGFKMVDGRLAFNADKAYKDSKLCNILFGKELSRRLELINNKIPVICWAPGLVIPRSENGFFRHSRKNNEIGQRLFALIARDILRITESPEGAGKVLKTIEETNENNNVSFKYLSNKLIGLNKHKLKEDNSSLESNDSNKAKELWELSNKLINHYVEINSI